MPAKKKIDKPKKDELSSKMKKEEVSTETANNLSPADLLRKNGIVTTFSISNKKMHRNVRDISVENITVLLHGHPLVEEADLTLNYGNRYGLIGRNGCGKSTLMSVIGARCLPIPDGIDIFHLKEEIEASDMTAKAAVMSVDVERQKLESEAEVLGENMTSLEEGSEEAEAALDRLNQIYERLEELDAATAETRASKILSGLGFTPDMQAKKTREFSGGWRMRIALARALFIQPTLLLLDEPTNHLDMEAVVWLEDYLSKWNKILFLVSHSQDFLNNVCTHMINFTRGNLIYYTGNYDSFVKTKSEKEEEQEKIFKREQDQINHMKEYIARFGQGNAKMARQAQSKEKTLDKMLKSGLTEKVQHEKPLDFKFPNPGKLAPPVLQCNDITFGYPGQRILFANVNFGIDLDSRIALVGPNGAGKSTLLKVISGELTPITGAVRPHPHLRISKFSQHFVDVLDLSLSPLDLFLQMFPDLTREEGRKFLGRYGISGPVQTQVIGQLSDGQKSRVVLAKMAKENPHVLFLDEPTNHLDMESIDSLAKAINLFEGGVVLVSHDMRLISQVAKEIWLCDNLTVMKFSGEINDFKMRLRSEMQKNNLIEGSTEASKAPAAMFVAITPVGKLTTAAAAPTVAPMVAPLIAPPAAKPAPVKDIESGVNKISLGEDGDEESGQTSDEKAIAKAKRKAEKEAALELQKKEEEERQRRREEKLRDIEEAKRLKEEMKRKQEEFLAEKAAQEAELKAKQEQEAQEFAIQLQKRREEKELRKQQKALEKAAKRAADRQALESLVLSDSWTQEEQIAFETALLTNTASMDKFERWTNIASKVPGKSLNQCLLRYKFIKDLIKMRQSSE